MTTVISVENLSKIYKLGQIGSGTLTNDLKIWWAKKTGRPHPLLKIGQTDYGNQDGEILWALRDVSFKVEKGEVLGIIGRNGAGKSTLLKILSRVTAPTSGQVKVKGRIASLLEVGTGFHPELTGRENIFLNGAILGMSRQEVQRKFDEIVNFAEVEKFVDTPVKRYSSGMYVRLAFAVAAHLESEILLVDEVLAVGDVEFQKKCLGKMGDVATNEGRTVFFVSHNMGSIEALCDKGFLMNQGTIAYIGSQSETINEYYKFLNKPINQNLSIRSDRKGNGDIKLVSLKLFDNFGNAKQNLFLGEPFTIEIEYSSNQKFKLENIEFTLVCVNKNNVKVFMQKMIFRDKKRDFPTHGITKFLPEKNILAPGDYYFRVIIRNKFEICDSVDHAFLFSVESEFPENSLFALPKNYSGTCIIDGKWELIQKMELVHE